jgi:hypothetical protein
VEIELFPDGGQIKKKRTSITTMGAKIQAFDIFQTPLSSHYPLPLRTFSSNIGYKSKSTVKVPRTAIDAADWLTNSFLKKF